MTYDITDSVLNTIYNDAVSHLTEKYREEFFAKVEESLEELFACEFGLTTEELKKLDQQAIRDLSIKHGILGYNVELTDVLTMKSMTYKKVLTVSLRLVESS